MKQQQKNKINNFLKTYETIYLKLRCFIYKIIIFFNLTKNSSKTSPRQSFLLPLILNILDVQLPEEASNIMEFSFGIFLMSLVSLLCFINVFGFSLSMYLIKIYNIETKFANFPILIKLIKYYEKSSLAGVIIEGLICIIFLVLIIIMCLLKLGITIINP